MSDEAVARVYCVEVDVLPARVGLAFPETTGVSVYLLDDEPAAGPVQLRATILRATGDLAPAGASLLMGFELAQVARQRVMRVVRIGRTPLDLQRADARSRVLAGTEFRSGARFEVPVQNRPSIHFSITLHASADQGLRGSAGGGGTRASAASAAQNSLLWLVPSIIETINDPWNRLKDGALEKLGQSGLSPRAFTGIIVVLMMMLGTGGFGLTQFWAAEGARTELAEVVAAQEGAVAAQQDAQASEAVCMVDRRALADRVNDADLARRMGVETIYARGVARGLAVEKGGRLYTSDPITAFDAEAVEADMRAILDQLPGAPGKAPVRCLDHAGALGKDLPAYVLSTHPDPTLTCPVSYLAVLEGASLRGSWGLSDRTATELLSAAQISANDAISEVPGFDPRDADRMAVGMLTAGVRAVRSTLLGVDLGGRPAMAPSEVNLWSLALFDAANRLPMAPPGAAPWTLAQCVGELLEQVAAAQTTVAPGEPLLPAVATVASGAVVIPAVPTATCAWPPDAVARGARIALRAVAIGAASGAAPTPLIDPVGQE